MSERHRSTTSDDQTGVRRREGGGSVRTSKSKDKDRKKSGANTISFAGGVEMQDVVNKLRADSNVLSPVANTIVNAGGAVGDAARNILGNVSKKGQNLFAKKVRSGERVHGTHLSRLVKESGLSPLQVQALANEYDKRVPDGRMSQELFKKELMFDANDEFGSRLFCAFCEGDPKYLSMDEFIIGVSRFAPRAKLDAKIDCCYDLFDVDKSGGVAHDEFTQVATYSLRLAKVGVSQEKLRQLIDAEWRALDVDGDGSVTRQEFQQHMLQNKEFVNALTIHVPWIQAAFRRTEARFNRVYLDTEPMISVLADLAVKVGAKIDDANKWAAVLKDNYFTDVGSLKELTNDDWTAMHLPRRLFSILHQLLFNRAATDDTTSNKVSRKVLKTRNNVMFTLKRKRLQILWGFLYFLGMSGLIIWTVFHYYYDYHDLFLLLSPSFIVSRVFGALLKLNFSLMLLPVCYRTLTWMRSTKLDHYIPIDSLMFFHRYVGMSLLVYGLAHTCAHFVNFYNLSNSTPEQINYALGYEFVTVTPTYAELLATRTGTTGLIMIISMLIMIPLASERFRRSRFNLFFSTHHLYMLIFICLALHDGLLFGTVQIVYWLIPSMFLFAVERIITLSRGAKTYDIVEGTARHKGDVLELRMARPPWYNYSAGHYTWINCPSVSKLEWHPFTLTSSPDEKDYISVHINLVGDWTKALGELCSPKQGSEKNSGKRAEIADEEEGSSMIFPKMRIDGPYGTASGDVFMYSHVILVGGGIGVTPFVSVLKSIAHKVRFENNCSLQGVHFIWVAKSQENFEWFIPILAEMMEHEGLHGFLKVSVYLTGTRYAINDVRLLGMSMLIKQAKTMLGEDLVTGLEASTMFGRPDFQKILLQANNEWAGNKIGCFFCGPAPLATSIKATCEAINKANRGKKTGARFNFKQEFF